jgi:predicted ribosomally synthesized peptide with nif11-like leader
MSKTRAAAFVKAVAETPELNRRVAAADRTPSAWIEIARESGYELSIEDLLEFTSEATGQPATESNAISLLVAGPEELDDADLEKVSGGLMTTSNTLVFKPALVFDDGNHHFGGTTRI